MARVKNGATTKARHKKVLKQAKGYFGSKHRLYKTAKEQLMHSGQYAFRDRKQKKREFRKLWITRINAACRLNDISYSKFINGLTKNGIEVNRKMLSEIAINDPKAFTVVELIIMGQIAAYSMSFRLFGIGEGEFKALKYNPFAYMVFWVQQEYNRYVQGIVIYLVLVILVAMAGCIVVSRHDFIQSNNETEGF